MNIKNTYVFLETEFINKVDLLNFISKKALENKITDDSKILFESFLSREKEASTGFEDGFAIPHAKIKNIKEPSVIIVKNKIGIEWDSLDGKPTSYIISLIIPDNANEEHLNLLSSIATKLTKEDFKKDFIIAKDPNELKKVLVKGYEGLGAKKVIKKNKHKLNIVAVTACVVGVAHTYIAEERLLEKYTNEGHKIRVETQGSKGIGTKLTPKEIEEADLVIIATDTNVDKSRFAGKKLFESKIAKAVKDPLKLLDEALANAKIYNEASGEFSNKNGVYKQNQGVIKHILAGISYMIPIIILGGICLAASLGIAKAIWGPSAGTSGPNDAYPWNPLAVMDKIGSAAFALMIPILAAFIANSIGGRAAIAPALVGGYIGNNSSFFMPLPGMPDVRTPMGFIGAIVAGLLIGYFTRWVNTWKVPKSLKAAMPIFFIPIVGGVGISVLFIYVIGGPIGWVMEQFSNAISKAYSSETIGLGLGLGLGVILGTMAAFDMGGPINKIAFVTCVALLSNSEHPIAEPMGALAAGIPVAPLGMGLTSLLFRRFFDEQERSMGASAFIMGMIGISEGAIPFAIRDPKRAITCNVLGGALAGGIAGSFRIQDNAGHGGPIVAILGAVPYGQQTVIFLIAIACGTLLTGFLYGFWLLSEKGTIGSLKEAYVMYTEKTKSDYNELFLEIKNEIKIDKKNNDAKNRDKLYKKLADKELELKNKLLVAKTAFNEIKVNDKNHTVSEKPNTKKYFLDIKTNKANKLKELTQITVYNSSDKKEINKLFKKQKNDIIKNYKDQYLNKKIDLHIKYVKEFSNRVN
ncbi:PTS system, fructose-specific IIB component [Spiroplasma corruscae]|uniref:PTS system, fructose-specific IIB component n=1 Tax=Spiroplasma corruscae TaxID=216934 RepID=A0A222EPR9_9MOLU|nr:fructose-specific PTS transporter subunit EIIC [Spiroplasma corruscae]ASP28442.1 PTS system, fructose-specific IIB component [Spiroplasma corruscae]